MKTKILITIILGKKPLNHVHKSHIKITMV